MLFGSQVLLSQNTSAKKQNPPFIIRSHIGVPKTITSNMFRSSFNGLFEGGLSMNFKLANNFYLGVGYQATNLKNKDSIARKVYNNMISYDTHFIGHSPFVKLSYDRYFKDNAYMDYSLNYGFMIARYTKVNEDTMAANRPYGPLSFNTHFVQPEVSANFIVDKGFTFSVLLSYTTLFSNFDPRSPRFNHFKEVNRKSNEYFMSWFTFGFGFNVLIGKTK